MSKRAVYKTYREENGRIELDLTVSQNDDVFEVKEVIHNIHIKDLSTDELNLVLSELDIPEEVKLEIKKAVLKKQVGLLENTKQRYDEIMPRLKDDVDYVKGEFEIAYLQFEERAKEQLKEIIEMEEKLRKMIDKD
ncbi:hypothetical protein RZE82_04765 [Mollicutes bacterium LVI A0039]|nr:hypothetical protein RZE82_04765 [Mollicutes bacterium LVI A0039]